MGFHDSDTWGGMSWFDDPGPEYNEKKIVEYVELDEIKNLFQDFIDSPEKELFVIAMVLNCQYDSKKFVPYLIKKDKEQNIYQMRESVFGRDETDFCDIHTNITEINFTSKKASGVTYNGNRFNFHRKYWDYEIPIKFVYINISPSTYVNIIGNELVTAYSNGIAERKKCDIKEAIALASKYYKSRKVERHMLDLYSLTWKQLVKDYIK